MDTSKIKVCHMTSVHSPGDSRIFYKECVSLAKAGYEVYLVQRGESGEKNGVHIVGIGQPAGGRLSRMTGFAGKIYRRALELDADIYHFHDPELMPCAMKLKRKGKKVIFDSHENYGEQILTKTYLPPFLRFWSAKVYRAYENRVLGAIDGAVIPCTFGGKNPFAGRCRHSEIIANYSILEELYDKYDPDHPKAEASVCYIGGLSKSRGIDQCIEASIRAGATLHLAGAFPNGEYQNEVMSRGGEGRIVYHGMLNREQVADLLLTSKIGLYLLQDVGQYLKLETLGIKAYEYMAMGLPIVMSRSAYNSAIMEKYQFGICVDPTDVEQIAHAIRYLLDHPEEARQMGENGRRAVKEEFNWGAEEKKLLALYEEILRA